MSNHPLVCSRDYFNSKFIHLPRNQREAGIEHLEWEDRIKPLRPLSQDIGYGIGVFFSLLFVGMAYF